MGIAGKCYRELSGGQQQRTLIARALCATDKLLIMDEPITGLDPSAIAEFYEIIRKLNREEGVAILMVSHDVANAVKEADMILHLKREVLFYGTTKEYLKSKAGYFLYRGCVKLGMMSEMLSYPFLVRALAGGILVSLCASLLGVSWC